MLKCVDSSKHQRGPTQPVLCNWCWVASSCSVSSCKSCDLDPLPTGLVKDCIDILVTPIVSIVNLSLSEGCFPSHFKSTVVSPLLKNPTFNRDDMKNYRPVSNLSFLSKILEKVVASRLNSYINSSHTSNDYQSACRKFHSTETALLNIHNDILSSMDDGRVTALTVLDLSAAFDTIDHTILLRRLGNCFGVSGKALDWFKSYLTGRSQRMNLGNCLSSRSDLSLESPRGQFLVLCFLHSIPLHLVAWSPDMLSLIISMLMIASCIYPFHQATPLQHWMVYNHAWLLFSHGCRQLNWNWTQIKRNSSSLGMNGNGTNIFLCFQ